MPIVATDEAVGDTTTFEEDSNASSTARIGSSASAGTTVNFPGEIQPTAATVDQRDILQSAPIVSVTQGGGIRCVPLSSTSTEHALTNPSTFPPDPNTSATPIPTGERFQKSVNPIERRHEPLKSPRPTINCSLQDVDNDDANQYIRLPQIVEHDPEPRHRIEPRFGDEISSTETWEPTWRAIPPKSRSTFRRSIFGFMQSHNNNSSNFDGPRKKTWLEIEKERAAGMSTEEWAARERRKKQVTMSFVFATVVVVVLSTVVICIVFIIERKRRGEL